MSASIRTIRLTNTYSGKKEVLETLQPGKLTMYSCGPTVYNLIHIGNLRGGLVADMFFRYFTKAGYDVAFVRNYTDVDDKIIQRGHVENQPAEAIAQKYTAEVERDYAAAGMLEPTHKTTVTSHIQEIVSLIERIISNGKAYVVDGEVLFSIESFPDYGKLSHKNIEDLVAGARVSVSEKKRNPLDFSLWKPAKPGEPSWDSPWGKGRPGWHIECSAMASKWLGDRIDVHHGGEDLIFPHHENEIAQSEGATGHTPFVKYWLHHAFLTLSKEKMSKSLGNVFTAREFLTKFSGEFSRYLLLSVHYRSPIDFGDETVEQTLVGLERIYAAKKEAVKQAALASPSDVNGEAWAPFLEKCKTAREKIDEAYANDFNTPGALGELFSLIREFNRIRQDEKIRPEGGFAARELVRIIHDEIGEILGVGLADPDEALSDLARIRGDRTSARGIERPGKEEIEQLIQARMDARKNKDFARADTIRKDLETRGVILKDGAGGTSWTYS
ncbi:MAG: cysteine--tRNA ligase [Bdellovibrionales bacterium GWB1_55_8]|nr:MAG: cysteine--tRNA ligase [Bdellovibrionales bacterium GWB1_55_8]